MKKMGIASNSIKLLEKIREGGQGTVYRAIHSFTNFQEKYWQQVLQTPVNDEHESLDERAADEHKLDEGTYVAKVFKGRNYGQWPEEVFGLHISCEGICQFEGCCNDGDSFYLLMQKYDCSLRNVIDKRMEENCNGIYTLS